MATTFDLSGLRKELAFQIGRKDLSDDRLDDFIHAGQKYLDDIADVPQTNATTEQSLTANAYDVTQQYAERIISVRLKDSDDVISKPLTRLTWEIFTNQFPAIADVTPGTPRWWTILPNIGVDFLSFVLRVGPPTSVATTVLINSMLSATPLASATDENVWSVKYPLILLEAAQMFVYSSLYHNMEGFREKKEVIATYLVGVDIQAALHEDPGHKELQG